MEQNQSAQGMAHVLMGSANALVLTLALFVLVPLSLLLLSFSPSLSFSSLPSLSLSLFSLFFNNAFNFVDITIQSSVNASVSEPAIVITPPSQQTSFQIAVRSIYGIIAVINSIIMHLLTNYCVESDQQENRNDYYDLTNTVFEYQQLIINGSI